MVVPFADKRYHELRPTLGIPRHRAKQLATADLHGAPSTWTVFSPCTPRCSR